VSGLLVSILVVNWNTRERVMQCLASLPNDTPGLSCEVIVIDNGSVDGSAEALRRQPEITLVCNERNVGYAAAVNQAYRRSSSEFVLLLNSDFALTPGASALSRSSSRIIPPRLASDQCT
jgi:GT2 family glycosyltransferase